MPRIALISDIHANLEALLATLRSVADMSPDLVVCLGDVVGYGPDPARCVEIIQQACNAIIVGNHDEAVLFEEDPPGFNEVAVASIRFSRTKLGDQHYDAIGTWPLRDDLGGLAVAHGSFSRRRYDYVANTRLASDAFTGFVGRFGAVGHTHIPQVFVQPDGGGEVKSVSPPPEVLVRLPRDARVIVNPGSVGQPRDNNPDASWGMLDTDARTFQIKRVMYDIDSVQRKMTEAKLPALLWERLRVGA